MALDLRRAFRRGSAAVLVALVAAQAIPIERDNPKVSGEVAVRPEVATLLRRACYDCHSNETVWPWYSRVAPVSWLVARDVHEGRDELNFSNWTAYSDQQRNKKLKETAEEVAEGEMPPWYYVLMHPEAKLDAAEREALQAWVAVERAQLGGPSAAVSTSMAASQRGAWRSGDGGDDGLHDPR